MKSKISNILKEYTKKNGISASFAILEDYAEELVKHGVQPIIQCEKCKYWKKYGNDPIIERCWGNVADLWVKMVCPKKPSKMIFAVLRKKHLPPAQPRKAVRSDG